MREIMRYVGNASSAETIRISPEVFQFTTDERKQFVKGFADVTGYIRKSNYAYHEPQYRVYFEIPHNWELVADFSNLLKSIDIPVQNIDWAHPNMRDGDLKKYNQGKPDFWKKRTSSKSMGSRISTYRFCCSTQTRGLGLFCRETSSLY